MKPMPAKPRSIMAQVEGSGTAPTALVVVIGGRIEYPVDHVVREVCDLRPRTATVFALEVELRGPERFNKFVEAPDRRP